MKEFTLSSGLKVELLEAPKGKHFRQAQKMIDGDQSMFQFALACQLLKVNGDYKSMADFDEMPMGDAAECVLLASTGSLGGEEEKKK
jgi:hypothetical protein